MCVDCRLSRHVERRGTDRRPWCNFPHLGAVRLDGRAVAETVGGAHEKVAPQGQTVPPVGTTVGTHNLVAEAIGRADDPWGWD